MLILPNHATFIESNKFWDAQESDIFPLPVVALALGVSRNRMCEIPVGRIMIKGRGYYRKSDILDWVLTDDGKKLLQVIKEKNSSIGKAAKFMSKAYDNYYNSSYESLMLRKRVRPKIKKSERVISLSKNETVIALAKLSEVDYRKERVHQAKLLRARTSTLDKAVRRAKKRFLVV